MSTIPQIATTMQEILPTSAERAGRQTGFVKRESAVSGSIFVQTMVFGLLDNPEASLSELTQTTAALGVSLSPQGLDQRFTEEPSLCLEVVLTEALHAVIATDPLAIPLVERFNGVYLQDSTTLVLPAAFADRWVGCGGSTTDGDAALKLQVQLNLADGRLFGQLQDGCESDRNSTLDTWLPVGAVRMAD